MDLRYGEKYEAFRAELREFLRGWPLTGADAELPHARARGAVPRARHRARLRLPPHPAEYGGAGASPTW
jgi:hypothetical protein